MSVFFPQLDTEREGKKCARDKNGGEKERCRCGGTKRGRIVVLLFSLNAELDRAKKEEAVINRELAYLPGNSSVSLRLLRRFSPLTSPILFPLSFLARATRRSVNP